MFEKKFSDYYFLTDNFTIKMKPEGNVDIKKKLTEMLNVMTKYLRELMICRKL